MTKAQPGTAATFGYAPVAEEARQGLVNQVFAKVAGRYDLMNDLMSAGLHRLWKDDLATWLDPPKHGAYALLDVAGGTGDIAFRVLGRAGTAARAIVCDISADMLRAGRARADATSEDRMLFLQANAEALPVADRSVDAYTIAFGIRNVTRIDEALAEAARVLRPGGRFLCLEFSQVETSILDALYERYSFAAIPALGALVAGDAQPYRYMVESIRRFPDQETFARMIAASGLEQVKCRSLSGGIAALHSAWRL